MISITDYIKEMSLDAKCRAHLSIDQLEDYFGSPLPQEIQEQFLSGKRFNNIIEENLQTHDTNKLLSTLQKQYNKDILNVQKNTDKPITSLILTTRVLFWKQHEKDINKILDFYNYYVTYTEVTSLGLDIYIEPLYSEKCNDYVYKTCKGIVYHITPKENLEKIMKSGLRVKNGPTGAKYRDFPEKIFLIALPRDKETRIKEKIKDIIKEIYNGDENLNELTILKIDLNGMNIDFYKDDAMKTEGCIYTFNHIPAGLINKVIDL